MLEGILVEAIGGLIVVLLVAFSARRSRLQKKLEYTSECHQLDLPRGVLHRAPAEEGTGRTSAGRKSGTEVGRVLSLRVYLCNVGAAPVEKLPIDVFLGGAASFVELRSPEAAPDILRADEEHLSTGRARYRYVLDFINPDRVVQFELVCLNAECAAHMVQVEAAGLEARYVTPKVFFRRRRWNWLTARLLGERRPVAPAPLPPAPLGPPRLGRGSG
jgi:hypothetical protein